MTSESDDIRARYEAAILDGLAVRVLRTSDREIAAAILDRLDADGLRPTTILTRVHPCDCQPCPECETAALAEGAVRQEAYLTDWRDIPIQPGGDPE
ncbi:hypothetical protein NDR87_31615 [Nocardia sp. CDC159]|uniref:Uncharacterized protein n=1 Tax=Nocardia pulmonis TaxID=2951408 RepID=A0A9X2EGI1_9NOCA|nr:MULTISPECIES: hypothetical protein [Nocardia]MCM6777901.1 hypothetical protein [Nocardia pulmonis]MCM6790928.1 hypothetical protein [Nocardia sp. CDC159]